MINRVKISEGPYDLNGMNVWKVTYQEGEETYSEYHCPKEEGKPTVIFNDRHCVPKEESQKLMDDAVRKINRMIYAYNKNKYMEERAKFDQLERERNPIH